MPRPRLPENKLKKKVTLRITSEVLDELRKIEKYTPKVEAKIIELIEEEKAKAANMAEEAKKEAE